MSAEEIIPAEEEVAFEIERHTVESLIEQITADDERTAELAATISDSFVQPVSKGALPDLRTPSVVEGLGEDGILTPHNKNYANPIGVHEWGSCGDFCLLFVLSADCGVYLQEAYPPGGVVGVKHVFCALTESASSCRVLSIRAHHFLRCFIV